MLRFVPALLLAVIVAVLFSMTPGAFAEVSSHGVAFAQTGEATVVVSADLLNVREGPGTNFRVVDRVNQGARLTELSRNTEGDWLFVRTPRSVLGWVNARYVTPMPTGGSGTSNQQASTPSVTSQRAGEATCPTSTFAPNTSTTGDAHIVECFGAGTTPVRFVTANTPVQALGVGDYGPPDAERERLGPGPYAKIRLWDGQYAWIAVSKLRVDATSLPRVAPICEKCDRVAWSSVVKQPTPVPVLSNPRPTNSGVNTSGCCMICTKGKACGNACISASKTCHVGPGCACNG